MLRCKLCPPAASPEIRLLRRVLALLDCGAAPALITRTVRDYHRKGSTAAGERPRPERFAAGDGRPPG